MGQDSWIPKENKVGGGRVLEGGGLYDRWETWIFLCCPFSNEAVQGTISEPKLSLLRGKGTLWFLGG